MSQLEVVFDLLLSFLAFLVVAVTLFLYHVVKLEPIAHVKSRLFTRFKAVKVCLAFSLLSVFFLWMAVTLELLNADLQDPHLALTTRFNLLLFELLWLSLYPLARIVEGNKRRREGRYRYTLHRLKQQG